ncbi:MAG: NAD(P)H-dependent oxidoreductase subunit E [Gammaproteobacteria bacterium]
MSQTQLTAGSSVLDEEMRAAIEREAAKFPPEQKRSVVLAALRLAQLGNGGWLSRELMDAVADYLELPPIAVYEVATFYTMYDLKPVGRHKIYVCTNISCLLRGSDEIVSHLKDKLGIGFGQTTTDGKFTLKEAECLAACGGAPMFQIGVKFHENLTPEKIDTILSNLD